MANNDFNEAENKILSRIRKMMALANDTAASEGERDNALRMTYNLLAKHNLSMIDVEASGQAQQEMREEQQATFVVYPWARSIASSVADLFFCKYYFMPGAGKAAQHCFIGRQSNAVTAQYLSQYIVKSVLREAAKLYGSATAPSARSFAVGVVNKLRERVRKLIAEQATEPDAVPGTALVLASLYKTEKDANETWLAEQGVTLRKVKSNQKGVTNAGAFHAGRDYGGKVSLAPQVGGSTSNTRKLT